ncbi:MAG TPA: MarR family winged helix-turn-helix transcriptional regulator [Conexibacter sp.]|nr:MarR family winged helix-turn-helix transcriptional regulator [Conexibacter sp.]
MSTVQAPGAMVLLTRLAKVVYRRSDAERLGMSLRWYVALSFLNDHDGASQQALGEALCIDANNLVLLLNELEAAEYAERRRDALDRRRHLVHITAEGRRALDRAEQAQEAVEADVLATLDADERATLRDLLARALGHAAPGPC